MCAVVSCALCLSKVLAQAGERERAEGLVDGRVKREKTSHWGKLRAGKTAVVDQLDTVKVLGQNPQIVSYIRW